MALTIGIVGGVVGFLILALLLMSVILYALVRRSVEKRQAQRIEDERELKNASVYSRTSVTASDTPEVPCLSK
jgi:hypothetical protein